MCDLCHVAFIDNLEKRSQIKVRNHCHNSGKFLGAVHSQCNTQYKDMSPHIILAHNGNKFDNHFVIDSISMHNDSLFPSKLFYDINVIAKSDKTYTSIRLIPFCRECHGNGMHLMSFSQLVNFSPLIFFFLGSCVSSD